MLSEPSELTKLMLYLEGYFSNGMSDLQKELMDGAQAEVAALEAQVKGLRELQAELELRALRLEPGVVMYKATPNLVPHAEALEKFLTIMRSLDG